ncbi:hypothetical protein ACX8XP_14720 [Calditrichota bacterium LG25]
MKKIIFDLYRYQILPKDRFLQLNIFHEIKSLDELIRKKNEIFSDALLSIKIFRTRKSVIKHKLIYQQENAYLFKFAVSRSVVIETENFTEEEIANWPSVLVFIWNDPEKQIIAIQQKWKAFQDTNFLAKAIIDEINSVLSEWNLTVYYKTIFLEKAFWDLINEYKGKIKDVNFELITPNLANISDALSEEIKQLAIDTNAAKTKYELLSDPDSSIIIDEDDSRINGLVHYSSEGGGDISLRISGFKKRIHTKNSKKHIELEEAEILKLSKNELLEIIKQLIQ